MGLDMYLRAKTDTRKYEGATGACSGLIGLAPNDDGMVEIGYWRKAYDQQDLICSTIKSYTPSDDNCVNFIITEDEIDTIISEAEKTLEAHNFDEEGDDLDGEYDTFNCQEKWEDTIEYFKTAKEILKTDPEAEIYYCQWY